jgi:competence ComEA-like helix-hairpin-helix protein
VIWGLQRYSSAMSNRNDSQLITYADSLLFMDDSIVNNNFFPSRKINPNIASEQELINLGFSRYIAQRIVKYREKGGKFYSTDDLLKIYKIDSALVTRLGACFIFPDRNGKNEKYHGSLSKSIIDINSADTLELEKLPGIGKTLARRITKYRNLLGGYYSVNQLKEVYGITDEYFSKFKSSIWADTSRINKINFSTASYADFLRHPYIEKNLANKFDQFRKKNKNVNLELLVNEGIITTDDYERLRWYIDF